MTELRPTADPASAPAATQLNQRTHRAAAVSRIGHASENLHQAGLVGHPIRRTHADLGRSHLRFPLRTSTRWVNVHLDRENAHAPRQFRMAADQRNAIRGPAGRLPNGVRRPQSERLDLRGSSDEDRPTGTDQSAIG